MCSEMPGNKQLHKQFQKTTVYVCNVGDASQKNVFESPLFCFGFLKDHILTTYLTSYIENQQA